MRRSIDDLLGFLSCPYCASRLTLSEKIDTGLNSFFGILECDCYRYAVLHDIPILQQLSHIGSNRDPVVEFLAGGNVDGAMQAAGAVLLPRPKTSSNPLFSYLTLPGIRRKRPAAHSNPATGMTDALQRHSFRETLYGMKNKSYADYLYYRFANNSYMAAFVFLMMLTELIAEDGSDPPRVLDLACGIGHTAHLAQTCHPDADVIGIDSDFGNLCLAKTHVAPNATFICLDAEMRLPFPDDFFSVSLALDGLHYMRGKISVLAELDRVLREDALWLFPHLHNALQENAAPGTPLPPEGWERLLDFLPHRILTEENILKAFIERDECDLSEQADVATLRPAKSLAAIGTRRQGVWHSYRGVAENSFRRLGNLSLNPIFEASPLSDDTVELTPRWPSVEMQKECSYSLDAFPEQILLTLEQFHSIRAPFGSNSNDARRLVNRFIAVCAPSCYAEA